MLKISARVLEYHEDSFRGKDGKDVKYNNAICLVDGKTVRLTTQVPLKAFEGKEVVLDVELYGNQSLQPKLRVVACK